MYKIRPAHLKDCQLVSKMITECAQEEGIMLPKTPQEIMENLSNFFVAEVKGKTIACCGYKIWVNGWVEIGELPHKIWGDCAYCPKNAAGPGDVKCAEVPMVLAGEEWKLY